MNQIIRELKRQFAGEKLEPEQLKGLIRAGYLYRNGDEHLLTERGRDALAQLGVHPGVANDPKDVASTSSIDLADETYLVMNELESFLDECRAVSGAIHPVGYRSGWRRSAAFPGAEWVFPSVSI
jgi:hypothetical protein